jgi:MFS family permease
VGGVVFFSFTAFFEPIADTFGWSHTQISLAISLRGMEMGIFAPIAGILVDRIGPKKMILWGLAITGAGLFMLSSVQSLVTFYAAFLLVSFGAGGCTAVVTTTSVAYWFNKKIGLAMGLMGSGIGAGGLMVMLIVWLIDAVQWRATLLITGVGMFILIIPMALIFKDRPEDMGLLPDGASTLRHAEYGTQETPKEVDPSLGEALKSRTFLLMNIIEVIRLAAIPAVIVHVMPYLSSVGIPRSTSGMVAASIPLLGIAGRFGFGWMGDRYNRQYVLAGTFLLLSLGLLAFGYAASPMFILPFLIGFPLGHGGSMVVRSAIVRDFFGRKNYGKLIGIILGAGAVGGIVGPTGAGWMYDNFGDYQLFWMVLSGCMLLCMGLVLKLKPVV